MNQFNNLIFICDKCNITLKLTMSCDHYLYDIRNFDVNVIYFNNKNHIFIHRDMHICTWIKSDIHYYIMNPYIITTFEKINNMKINDLFLYLQKQYNIL